ncbi:MAG TPA: proton-conducting transporter membrane subunit [Streptosporangiaceae bacterium]|jgi:hydrogenase-4 component F|nr:proton-conducting transporter membrane subunit [Streptosporangiaceae bacterium]
MTTILVLLLTVPVAAALAAFWLPPRAGQAVTAVTGVASFAAVIALVPAAAHHDVTLGSYLRVDALSVVFMLATSFLYGAVSIYLIGYLKQGDDARTRPGQARYGHRLLAGINIFAWSMLAAPMMNSLALLWVAVEVTTVVSALLVALEGTDGAAEAAWKYVLIASAGLGVALLGTIFAYYAGEQVLGQSYALGFVPLLHAAAHLPPAAVRLMFVLAVLGFGTKVGLFPVHTWLPDAHSEAPAPVSALLSGSLLAVSFYAILRYYQVAQAALGTGFPRAVLLTFGVATLALAALSLLDQRDLKRLFAYSSVEHMGILAIGVSFGVPVALVGVLLHVLAHAAAKGNAFMGAGVMLRKLAVKHVSVVRGDGQAGGGGLDLLPWSGPLLLVTVLALSALPPFGVFRSEFLIVAGGFSSSHDAVAAVLVVLVTVAFFGLSATANAALLGPAPDRPGAALARGEPSAWMVVPVLAGLAALLVLGLHPPAHLTELLTRGAAELRGRS